MIFWVDGIQQVTMSHRGSATMDEVPISFILGHDVSCKLLARLTSAEKDMKKHTKKERYIPGYANLPWVSQQLYMNTNLYEPRHPPQFYIRSNSADNAHNEDHIWIEPQIPYIYCRGPCDLDSLPSLLTFAQPTITSSITRHQWSKISVWDG